MGFHRIKSETKSYQQAKNQADKMNGVPDDQTHCYVVRIQRDWPIQIISYWE